MLCSFAYQDVFPNSLLIRGALWFGHDMKKHNLENGDSDKDTHKHPIATSATAHLKH